MSDSTSLFQALTASTANLAARIHEKLDSVSPAALGGRNADTTVDLTWGYYGGDLLVDGVATAIANGTRALTPSATNYLTISRTGTVSIGTTAPAGDMLLYTIVAGAASVSSYTDNRTPKAIDRLSHGLASIALTTANVTLTQAQAMCDTLVVTGALTAVRDLVVPLVRRRWAVRHTGTGFDCRVIGATGTGITIGIGKAAIVECDGTNVNRITADV